VPIDESSKKYTAFVIPDGHYKFNRVPFGLCNSLAVFQKYIIEVFKELFILSYMDDLMISSDD